jgi:hypothetical protein
MFDTVAEELKIMHRFHVVSRERVVPECKEGILLVPTVGPLPFSACCPFMKYFVPVPCRRVLDHLLLPLTYIVLCRFFGYLAWWSIYNIYMASVFAVAKSVAKK